MTKPLSRALLNARDNPRYDNILQHSFGLVFFGCPHNGGNGVPLGRIASNVARFITGGRASNELLDCLEKNSLFARDAADRFRHQLENYRVVSFVETRTMHIAGRGITSVESVSSIDIAMG